MNDVLLAGDLQFLQWYTMMISFKVQHIFSLILDHSLTKMIHQLHGFKEYFDCSGKGCRVLFIPNSIVNVLRG